MRFLLIIIYLIIISGCMSTSHTVNAPVVSDNEQLIHPVENVTESLSSIELPVELTDTQVPADITNLWEYIAVNATTLDAEHPRITKRQQWYLKDKCPSPSDNA
mgnify:FL=1